MSLEVLDGRGRISPSDNPHLKTLVKQKSHKNVRKMSQRIGIRILTVLDHLEKFDKMKRFNKCIHYKLSESQIIQHFQVRLMLASAMIHFLTE